VWAGSYLGLLPVLGILSPATRHPTGRNALMIAAHIIWGATLGILTDYGRRSDKIKSDEALGI
jgi:putative membrane protein